MLLMRSYNPSLEHGTLCVLEPSPYSSAVFYGCGSYCCIHPRPLLTSWANLFHSMSSTRFLISRYGLVNGLVWSRMHPYFTNRLRHGVIAMVTQRVALSATVAWLAIVFTTRPASLATSVTYSSMPKLGWQELPVLQRTLAYVLVAQC